MLLERLSMLTSHLRTTWALSKKTIDCYPYNVTMYRTAIRRAASSKPPSQTGPVSTTETMMPWNGWFSNFLKAKLGSERYEQLTDYLFFTKDDIHDLHGIPNPSTKVDIGDGQKAMFRYPSPGSQDPVRLPEGEEGYDPYNIAYYPRDFRSVKQPVITAVRSDYEPKPFEKVVPLKNAEEGISEALAEIPESSPGNKGTFATGKSDFDPSGLRAAMSTNHEAVQKNLDKLMPTGSPAHVSRRFCLDFQFCLLLNTISYIKLPTYEWESREDEIIEWYESRGLPVPMGARMDLLNVDRKKRVAQWT